MQLSMQSSSGNSRKSHLVRTFIFLLGACLLVAACDTPDKPYVVEIARTNSFLPATLTVPRGAKVVWKNRDHEVHSTVLAQSLPFPLGDSAGPSGAVEWDSGDMVAGAMYEHTFHKVGTYLYACHYHDEMVGTIVVTEDAGLAYQQER
jgi:plastocyanin